MSGLAGRVSALQGTVSRNCSGIPAHKLIRFPLAVAVIALLGLPGRGRICQRRRLKPIGNGLFEASARWGRNWPNLGRGTYFVSWYEDGSRFGHILAFKR